MSLVRNARRTAVVVAALAVGACGDSTAPTIDFIDAQAASAKVAPVAAVMDQPALASFTSLGDVPGVPTQASAAVAAVARMASSTAEGRWDPVAPRMARASASSADVLPPDVRDKLYTYNEATRQYEGAASAEAPANGARIVLYAWDLLAGRPSSPLTPIGHVDLIDQSNASQNRLAVIVVRADGSVELMNYAITHSVTTSSESFSIAGSATDGVSPVTFSLSGTASDIAGTVTFDLSAPSVGFSVHVEAHVNVPADEATIRIALAYDGHTLRFDLSATSNSMDGEIKFDGKRYATIAVTTESGPGTVTTTATFQKANGQPLTAEELQQIENLFERALDFDRFWAGLLWPIGALATPA